MLIAYFPSYYVAHNNTNIIAYIKDFFLIEKWPVGPPWFIWVLFLFNLLFAFTHSTFHKLYSRLGKLTSNFKHKPFLFFAVFLSFTWILYVPIAYNIGAGTWTGFGPFDFQLSRILLYLGYFMVGVFIGNSDFNVEIFSEKALLVKKWRLWIVLALIIYAILTIIGEPLAQMVKDNTINEFNAWMIYYTVYVASCTLSCIAFITTFRKLVNTESPWWNSISENAYLIYLTHYIFVTWIQFSLLNVNFSAFIKFALTFMLSLVLSWWTSVLLRKFKIMRTYL